MSDEAENERGEFEFDPAAELTALGDSEHYGLDIETYFRLAWSCSTIAGLSCATTFFVRPIPHGCAINFVLRRGSYDIKCHLNAETGQCYIGLLAGPADRAGESELVFTGFDAPEQWQALVRALCRVERAIMYTNLADNLKANWQAYAQAQERVRRERGF
jgi:hypothetical protein